MMSAPEIEGKVEVNKPATTYEWLSSLPIAANTGSTIYSWYEDSKNCCRLTKAAIGTVESSIKYAAETAAPLVKRLDRPIQVVDSFAVQKLVKLEEKVPSIRSQPDEVFAYLSESKDAFTSKIMEKGDAIKIRFNEGKDAIGSRLSSGRDTVYSAVSSGSDKIINSHAGVLVCEGKEAVSARLSQSKEYISSSLVSGRDLVYTKVQKGAELLANTRAGTMLGSGVDHTLQASENWVEYLLPREKNEEELLEGGEGEIEMKEAKPPVTNEEAEDDETGEEEPVVTGPAGKGSRIERVKVLSRKVRIRMYYRSLRKLNNIQQQCKSTLEQLKATIDLLKLAQSAREGMDKQYQNLTATIKDLEGHVKQMLSHQVEEDPQVGWLPEESGEQDGEIKWLNPKPKTRVQVALDSAKALSERVFTTFRYVASAATYLPHHLKGGATGAYEKAQELYTTLKPVKLPSDLPAAALGRISEILEIQLGYVRQLGQYITSALQSRQGVSTPDDKVVTEESTGSDESEGQSSEEEDEREEERAADPSTSQPPGSDNEDKM